MPTIKRKVEMNLIELIDWAWENDITGSFYANDFVKAKRVRFESGTFVAMHGELNKCDTFTVETEGEITEDTVIPQIIGILRSKYSNSKVSMMHKDKSVNEIIKGNNSNGLAYETLTLHIINDDGTHTLIWRDGKLVE